MSRHNSGVAALALFAALAGLVAADSVTGIDQWAVNHAMPGVRAHGHKPTLAEALVPFLHTNFSALDVATNAVTAPASVLVSLLVLLGLRRRIWIAAWLAGTIVEEVGKTLLTRPALYSHGAHVVGFDSSYPSGHTIRTIVLAAAVASTWPGARRVAAAWAVAAVVLLEVDGWHTPSDVAGGLLLAVAALGLLRGRAA